MAVIDVETETAKLEKYWQDRDTQIKEDRDRINLIKPPPKSDKIEWFSPEPKVQYDTAVSMMSLYAPRVRMPLSINYSEEEKKKMSKAERFIIGIFRELDKRQYARGQSYWFRELAYWILSGWYAVFTVVRENNGQAEFVADLLDPLTVYPEWDANELVKCVRTYNVDRMTARAMVDGWISKGLKTEWREPDLDTPVKVINYWQKDGKDIWNVIMMAGQVVKQFNREPFDHIPIKCGTVGLPERITTEWKKRIGDNFIASYRDVNDYENVLISLLATVMSETTYPNLVTKTRTGSPAVQAEDVRKPYGEVIPIKLEESLELMKYATAPAELLQLLSWVQQKRQKALLPDVVWGGLGFEASGFAISQLMAALKYKISPYLNTAQFLIGQIASELLNQYGAGDFPKVKLTTTNPKEMKKGLFFIEEFSKSDVPESTYVEVTIPITSALDKTQQILFSRQALQAPQLLSRETLWDEVLDVQDSEQEYARILQDETLELPVVKQIMMIEQLKKRADEYQREGHLPEATALRKYIMMIEMQLGMRQGIPIKPGESNPGPEGMPPEMMNSPDMQRAAMNVSPPGLARRPQTQGERAETKNTRGTLYNPAGQQLL